MSLRVVARFWPHILSVIALVVLVFVSSLLWLEVQKRFPSLPTGSYLGVVKDIFPDEPLTGVYVSRDSAYGPIDILVLRPGWVLETINPVARDSQNSWLHPITVSGPSTILSFIGSITDSGKYVGVVSDTEHRIEGSWELMRIPDSNSQVRATDEDLRLWLSLRAELLQVERKITDVNRKSEELDARIEVLQEQIQKGEGLREHGQGQYLKAQEEREQAKATLEAKLRESKQLQDRVELAQKVTEAGRLVWLAREVSDRENAWLKEMLSSTALSSRPDNFEEQLDRSAKIIQLKREIALERIKIRELQESNKREQQ